MSQIKYRVFVAEAVSPKGLELLRESGLIEVIEAKDVPKDKIPDVLAQIDGLIVRSATQVNAEYLSKTPNLKVVGRAGVGVDNVDVDAASERGILVMNTPGGNTVSTAEHALSLLFALARHIPQAHASMKAGKWDRKSFQGTEICGKRLGIIGMGRIGTEVAKRAVAMGMRVSVYDPFLSLNRAKALEVELKETVDMLVPDCDFLTLHTPMTPETKGILNSKTLGLCRKGVRIVNCARGGLIDEAAMIEGLKSGQIGSVALDVYEEEPPAANWIVRDLPNVVLTPHLGASTAEAQENVGIEVAEQINDYLLNGVVKNSVNLPNMDAKTMEVVQPYLMLGQKLGLMLAQVGPKRADRLTVRYHGTITDYTTASITRAILEGYLRLAGGGEVNRINVTKYAQNLGLEFSETKMSEPSDYSELIEIELSAGAEKTTVAATFFGVTPRIVRFNGSVIESATEGVLFFMENKDRPGIVGWIGTLMGRYQVNIANMALSRSEQGGRALTILQLDSVPSDEALAEVKSEADIYSVRLAKL